MVDAAAPYLPMRAMTDTELARLRAACEVLTRARRDRHESGAYSGCSTRDNGSRRSTRRSNGRGIWSPSSSEREAVTRLYVRLVE